MPGVSLQEYRELIVRSGLLTSAAVQEQLSSYSCASGQDVAAKGSDHGDAASFAKHLEQSGLLTAWQNANLLRGRFRGLVFGKFRILRMLGSGGMGRVFLAENQLLKRKVALKVLPKKLGTHPTALERFHREARALARLNHDNIVRIYDVDVHEDTHYIVMEYVQGVDLHRKVASSGPLDAPTAANLIGQAAGGLAHAHDAGLIHRDVKPANMLLDPSGTIKVLDLGLALLQTDEDGAITADPTKALGTADYISPEQALNSRNIDARTDIYSLGCSLYFLLTGTAPFGIGTDAQRLLAHQLKEPEPINQVRSRQGLPPVNDRMLSICRQMMAKDPSQRYAKAAQVAAELSALTVGAEADSAGSSVGPAVDAAESRSSLDIASLQQLQTISESASITSFSKEPRSSGGRRGSPGGRRGSHWNTTWWLAAAGAVTVLLITGIYLSAKTAEDAPPRRALPARPWSPRRHRNRPCSTASATATNSTGAAAASLRGRTTPALFDQTCWPAKNCNRARSAARPRNRRVAGQPPAILRHAHPRFGWSATVSGSCGRWRPATRR